MSNLTDSQEKIVAAIRREVVEITQPIKDEIAALRKEQKERHEAGIHQAVNEQQIKYAKLKQTVKRIANSLLHLLDGDE